MNKKSGFLIYPLIVMGLVLMLTNSCKKKDDNNDPTPIAQVIAQVPVLTTSAVSNITQTTASCGGNITSDGGAMITVRGVCWSTSQNPTTANSKTTDGTGIGNFTSSLTGLTANALYYLRAYATNSAGTAYGSEVSFTRQQVTVTDIDGNVYHTIPIGTQVWMVENLKTTKYRNGDPIPNVTDGTAWGNLTTGAYCSYNNDTNNSTIYGKLYNWYAVNDSRNIAPTGWHVPTDAEWRTLLNYSGGAGFNAGDNLKEAGTTHWQSPNIGPANKATNATGFTALPGGVRNYDGSFFIIGSNGYWWTSSIGGSQNSIAYGMYSSGGYVDSNGFFRSGGVSVRCVKDF